MALRQDLHNSPSQTLSKLKDTRTASFEKWLAGLNSDKRRGADFWTQERSKPKAISCLAVEASSIAEFVVGCREAQSRLSLPDVLRRTESEYRKGWNTSLIVSSESRPDVSMPASAVEVRSASPTANDWFQSGAFMENSQVLSSALGTLVKDVQSLYPNADCSGDLCEFNQNRTPQQFCPAVGPCERIVLFTDKTRVNGYTADFRTQDWMRSLSTTIAKFGKPIMSTVRPSGQVRMRSDYWTWSITGGLKLNYICISGYDAYGGALDAHSIMISPKSEK